MIVVDASALLELLLHTDSAEAVADRLFAPDETLHAPHLLDLEVAQVLRRYVSARAISAGRGDQALVDLSDLPIRRYPHAPFLERIWELRNAVTAYDAAYLVLAETLDAPLLTRDRRLARVQGIEVRVEAV